MKSYHICLLTLLVVIAAGYKNTTDFWAKQLNDSNLHFHAYAGTLPSIQDINKSIGTILKAKVECFTTFSELSIMMLWSLVTQSPSLFGFKEVLEAAHNLVLSLK